jgi:ribosomal protein S18 acetylase RimI-like enzyme
MEAELERMLLSIEMSYFNLINPVLDKAAMKHFRKVGKWKFYDQLADGGFLHLQSLAVSAKHQGQGIGKALIQWGQKFAVDHQLPVTLEASVTGRIVYGKLGFMIIDRETVSASFEGVAMLWEPPADRGRWLEYYEDGVHAKVKIVLT